MARVAVAPRGSRSRGCCRRRALAGRETAVACGVRRSRALRALGIRMAQRCEDGQWRQDGVEPIDNRPGYLISGRCASTGAWYRGCGLPFDVFESQHALDSSSTDSDARSLALDTLSVARGPRRAWQESSSPDGGSLCLHCAGGLRPEHPEIAEQSNPLGRADSVRLRPDVRFRASIDLPDRTLSRAADPDSNKCNMRDHEGLVRKQPGNGRRAASLGGGGNGRATVEASTEWSWTATT